MNKSDFTSYNSVLKNNSRSLRKNMTKQERKLWYNFLKDYKIIVFCNYYYVTCFIYSYN